LPNQNYANIILKQC